LLRIMERSTPVNLIFLDACRDNPLAVKLARTMGGTRSAAVGRGLATTERAMGSLIAYATQPDNVAADGAGEHSPFAAALLQNIETPGLEVRAMLTRVRNGVLQATAGKQQPWDHSSLTVEFYFRLSTAPAVAATPPSPTTDSAAIELAFWQSISNSADRADYEAYLAKYPNGEFASLARNRLASLKAGKPAVPQANTPSPPPDDESPPAQEAPVPRESAQEAEPTSGAQREQVVTVAPESGSTGVARFNGRWIAYVDLNGKRKIIVEIDVKDGQFSGTHFDSLRSSCRDDHLAGTIDEDGEFSGGSTSGIGLFGTFPVMKLYSARYCIGGDFELQRP